MIKPKLYKYFNILIQAVIASFAIYVIYNKLHEDFGNDSIDKINTNFSFVYILFAFLLMFINWGIEAFKWKVALSSSINISYFKAYKNTLTAVTASLITPNRLGEVPFRALLLGKKNFKIGTLKTIVSSYCQLIITFLFGALSLLFIDVFFIEKHKILLLTIFLCCLLVMILALFKVDKIGNMLAKFNYFKKYKLSHALKEFSIKQIWVLLVLSSFRYIVFSLQFYLTLYAFGVCLNSIYEIMLIPFFFLATTVIPSILITEIGVRGSVAILLFSSVSNAEVSILLASIALWIINVAFPALFGIVNIKQLKLLSSE